MKTKFILHGGFAKGEKQENDAFFKEILSTAPEEVKILLVYFAKEPNRISKNKDGGSPFFRHSFCILGSLIS